MKTLAAAAIVGLFCATALALDVPEGFLGSYDKALELAKKENKPLYLHFTTDWCGWCRKIEKDDYANPKGQAALKDFVAASLDCTQGEKAPADNAKNQKLMEKYGGSGYPYIVILAPDGTKLYTIEGYKPLEGFLADLKEAKDASKKYGDFVEYAKKADVKSYEYNRKAMDVFETTDQWDKAAAAAQQVLDLDANNAKGDAAAAKLVLLEAAQAAEGEKDAKKIAALQADIRKLDPANEKGVYEKMISAQVEADLQSMTRANRDEVFKKVEATLIELSKMKNLKKAQEVLFMLGRIQAAQNRLDDALATEETALKADPNSPHAAEIKTMIERIKTVKSGARTTRPATTEE